MRRLIDSTSPPSSPSPHAERGKTGSAPLSVYGEGQGVRFARLIGLVAPAWRWIILSVLLGFATIASSIFLMANSAYIIARAALHPSISDLSVAIVGVR